MALPFFPCLSPPPAVSFPLQLFCFNCLPIALFNWPHSVFRRWPASRALMPPLVCWVAPRRKMCVQLRSVNWRDTIGFGFCVLVLAKKTLSGRPANPFAHLNIYVIGLKFPFGSHKKLHRCKPQWNALLAGRHLLDLAGKQTGRSLVPKSCSSTCTHTHIKNLKQLHNFPRTTAMSLKQVICPRLWPTPGHYSVRDEQAKL